MPPATQANDIDIKEYEKKLAPELHRLLLALHAGYFRTTAPGNIVELSAEKDVDESYNNYINYIHQYLNDNWKVYLAIAKKTNEVFGFIIGSAAEDEYLVKGKIGKIEDWFVADSIRREGVGRRLYETLEKWFRAKQCDQIVSDTWQGNELSINAHLRSGFFVSGVLLSKKLR